MKDPAFLFYPNDYIGGTMGMTFEEKGAYIELLMAQFNRGHMTTHMIGQVLGQKYGQIWETVQHKFIQDNDGRYYNVRLEEEQKKRKAYVSSRKNNINGSNQYTKKDKLIKGDMSGHMTSHMENENIYINWRKDYNMYIKMLNEKFEEFKKDTEWIKKMQKMYPGIDIVKSMELSILQYWGTETGWENKKNNKKTDMPDWKMTFAKTLKNNLVEKSKQPTFPAL